MLQGSMIQTTCLSVHWICAGMVKPAGISQRAIACLIPHAQLFPLTLFGFGICQPLNFAFALGFSLPL
jgi:hypothetical protein